MNPAMPDNIVETRPSKIGRGEAGAMTVLAPKESLTYQTCEELEAAFNECIDRYKTKIILDCKKLSFVDSEGLELLVRVEEKLRRRGGILKIVGLNPVCRDIFVATRLINSFYIYKDIHEAVKAVP